jgi:glutamyl-tRNA synthetase
LLAKLADLLAAQPDLENADAAKEALKAFAATAGVKPGALMFPLRVALSGRAHGPDLGGIIAVLGSARSAERVRKFIANL